MTNYDKCREAFEVPDLGKMVAFLSGESTIFGLGYGDKHPTERGAFWWRKHLKRAEDANKDLLIAKQAEIDELVKALKEMQKHYKLVAGDSAYKMSAMGCMLDRALAKYNEAKE